MSAGAAEGEGTDALLAQASSGRDIAERAVRADEAGELQAAGRLYLQASDALLAAVRVGRMGALDGPAAALMARAYLRRADAIAALLEQAEPEDSSGEDDGCGMSWSGPAGRPDFRAAARRVILGLRVGQKSPAAGEEEEPSSGVDIDADRISGENFLTFAAMPKAAAKALGALFPQGKQPHILWAADVVHRKVGTFGRLKDTDGRIAVLTPAAFYIGRSSRLDRCVELSDIAGLVVEKDTGWAALKVPRQYDLAFLPRPAGPAAAAQLQRLWELLPVLVKHHQRQSDSPPSRSEVPSLQAAGLQLKPPQGFVAPKMLEITVGRRQQKVEVEIVSGDQLIVQDSFSSDPYVVVHYAGETKKTQVRHHTLCPLWDETFTFPHLDDADTVECTVYDYDVGQGSSDGDFMGHLSFSPLDPPNDPAELGPRRDAAGMPLQSDVEMLKKLGRANFGRLRVRARVLSGNTQKGPRGTGPKFLSKPRPSPLLRPPEGFPGGGTSPLSGKVSPAMRAAGAGVGHLRAGHRRRGDSRVGNLG
eukprot:TRINITY_DN13183_c0_g1_i2.p1 TRINITY_DN13183_c0_g1~~TRINITY_DN13183_c0_g1_i2.p1  ORF type:complete len:556 (+),score=194.31 TRINITY_DN13183_c0_g1_i2:70-1668(+)